MARHHPDTSHLRRRTSRWLAASLGTLALTVATAQADGERRGRKPVQPSIQIDNEGPAVVIRPALLAPGDHGRFAGPDDGFWFPGRSIIRLDLILPIHTRPTWVFQPRPRPWRPWIPRP